MREFINNHPFVTLMIVSSVAANLAPVLIKYVELKHAK